MPEEIETLEKCKETRVFWNFWNLDDAIFLEGRKNFSQTSTLLLFNITFQKIKKKNLKVNEEKHLSMT